MLPGIPIAEKILRPILVYVFLIVGLRLAGKRELVSTTELAAAARRHGYLSLDDVERATLEPGGSLTFEPRAATTRVRRHDEIMSGLDSLHRSMEKLRQEMAANPNH
jgi:uncharacterized membrane protein YcaP (DUF421 family)